VPYPGRWTSGDSLYRNGIAGGKGFFDAFVEELLLAGYEVFTGFSITGSVLGGEVGIFLAGTAPEDVWARQFARLLVHVCISEPALGATLSIARASLNAGRR
jgi:hypothetical protein